MQHEIDIQMLKDRYHTLSRNVYQAQENYDALVASDAISVMRDDAWERYVVAVSKRNEFEAVMASMGLWSSVMLGEVRHV